MVKVILMSIKFPYYHGCLLISENPSDLTSIFHDKLIFNTLTNEHLTRIFVMQKIKQAAKNPTQTTIYFHNCKLEDFNLNKKLTNFIKEHKYSVYIKNIADVSDQDIIDIATYSKFMETYRKKDTA